MTYDSLRQSLLLERIALYIRCGMDLHEARLMAEYEYSLGLTTEQVQLDHDEDRDGRYR